MMAIGLTMCLLKKSHVGKHHLGAIINSCKRNTNCIHNMTWLKAKYFCQTCALIKSQENYQSETFKTIEQNFQTCFLPMNVKFLQKSNWIKNGELFGRTIGKGTSVILVSIRGFHGSRNIPSEPPWRVLFFGSDDFSLVPLKALNKNRLSEGFGKRIVGELEVVCTQAMTPVRQYAEEMGLHIHNWPLKLDGSEFDVGVLASFGRMIPKRIINAFPYGILNIHPSLLPRWRGAAPIFHTILHGDSHTGVCIMKIHPKQFDVGPLLFEKKIAVPEKSTSTQLAETLASIGTELIMDALNKLPNLEELETEQRRDGITYAPKICPGMEYIDWENQTMEDIDRQYRALHEVVPLKSKFQGQEVKLLDMIRSNEFPEDVESIARRYYYRWDKNHKIPPGCWLMLRLQGYLLIRCKDGWVGFKKVTMKKTMDAQSFYNGVLSKSDRHLDYFESQDNGIKTKSESSYESVLDIDGKG